MNRKVLGIAFLGGILLCGLGAGVAFAQYSKFEYAGEKTVGGKNMVSETMEADMPGEGTVYIDAYGLYYKDIEFVTDAEVPVDKIAFDAVYNPERMEMGVSRNDLESEAETVYITVDENGNEISRYDTTEANGDSETVFHVGRYKYTSDAADFFAIKDDLLADLKKGKIATYDAVYMDRLTVRINPANVDRINMGWD